MSRHWWVLVGLSLALGGCDTLRSRVTMMGARELKCPEDSLKVSPHSHGTFVVRGCQQPARIYQCHRWNEYCASLSTAAEQRFMREYGCAMHGGAVNISPYIFAISGCNQRTTYRCRMSRAEVICEHER